MFENIKIKILLFLLAATLIVPAFLLAYQPRDQGEGSGLARDLWGMIEAAELPAPKGPIYSKEFPAGFKDASMGKATAGPIKVEGG